MITLVDDEETRDEIAIVLHLKDEAKEQLKALLLPGGPLHVRVIAKLIEDES